MSRLLVTWRSRTTQRTHPVGLLETGETFTFSYLNSNGLPADFRPFMNFPDVDTTYMSRVLFPFFAQRVMSRRRPDYLSYLAALGLSPEATDVEVLARAGGRRKGDTVEVVEEPAIRANGAFHHAFLVRGTRYQPGHERALSDLTIGSSLVLSRQRDNVVNPEALLVCALGGQALGWVPDALLPFTHEAMRRPYELTALRINGTDWPDNMRLIVEVRGTVDQDFEPFAQALLGQHRASLLG